MLLERGYWRNRLQALRLARPSAVYTPRPDLSSRAVAIEEFRIRAHDGLRLTGLMGRRLLGATEAPVRLRIVPGDRVPEPDLAALRAGIVEYALQFPAGRRLEDRVLDVMRVCQLAAAKEGLSPQDILLHSSEGDAQPDEFLIVTELLSSEVVREDR
jgi:hypothetical protein